MDDRLEAGYRRQTVRKDAVKMVEATVYRTKEKAKEMQIEALKRKLRTKECMAKEYLRSDPT